MKTLSYFFLALFLGQAFGTPVNPACLSTFRAKRSTLEERDFSSIVSSLGKRHFQSRFRLNRRAANRSYEWRGPDRSQALRAVQTDYAYEFSPEGLAYHKERDRNPFAVVETIARWRWSRDVRLFNAARKWMQSKPTWQESKKPLRQEIATRVRAFSPAWTKVKNAPVEFLRSLTLDPVMSDKSVPARTQWPQAGGPLPNHELVARYQDALFNFYTVKDKQGRSVDRNDPALAAHFRGVAGPGNAPRRGLFQQGEPVRWAGTDALQSWSRPLTPARDRQLQHFQSASEWFEKIRNGTY